jgi:hypothetical protein
MKDFLLFFGVRTQEMKRDTEQEEGLVQVYQRQAQKPKG